MRNVRALLHLVWMTPINISYTGSVEQLSKCPSDISTVKFAAFIKLFPRYVWCHISVTKQGKFTLQMYSLFFNRESLTVDEIHLAATAWEGTENLSREELEVILNHMQVGSIYSLRNFLNCFGH